jgi:hypothetical protein
LPGLAPAVAHAAKPDKTLPLAIAGGTVLGPFGVRHFYFPTNPTPLGNLPNTMTDPQAPGDPSTIRDFNGIVGVAEFPPTGTVTGDPRGGIFWAADVRFMQGEFMDRKGNKHQGTLSFI